MMDLDFMTYVIFLLGVGWYGSIANPPIASDFLQHTIANSVSPTLLSSLPIPANTVTGLQALQYDLTGFVIQNTGISQNTPTISITINGFTVWNGPVVTPLPNSGALYWFRYSLILNPSNGSISILDCYTWFELGLAAGGSAFAELIRNKAYSGLSFNATQSNTINITVTNPVANVNYSTTIQMQQLRAF